MSESKATEPKGLNGLSSYMAYVSTVFYLRYCRRYTEKEIDYVTNILALRECKTLEEYQEVSARMTGNLTKAIKFTDNERMEDFKSLPKEARRALLLECLTHYTLSDEQKLSILSTFKDENGVKYSRNSISNLDSIKIAEMILDAFVLYSDLHMDFGLLDDDDWKLFENGLVDLKAQNSEIIAQVGGDLPISTMIPLALKRMASKIREAKLWQSATRK